EMLVLEGAQAGLSWMTILKRREAYRAAFEQFDPQKVAAFDEANEENLLQNEGIIRNKQKIRSAVNNARAFLNVQDDFGSFHALLVPVMCYVYFQEICILQDHMCGCFLYKQKSYERGMFMEEIMSKSIAENFQLLQKQCKDYGEDEQVQFKDLWARPLAGKWS